MVAVIALLARIENSVATATEEAVLGAEIAELAVIAPVVACLIEIYAPITTHG
jgi:hypothetical protein